MALNDKESTALSNWKNMQVMLLHTVWSPLHRSDSFCNFLAHFSRLILYHRSHYLFLQSNSYILPFLEGI